MGEAIFFEKQSSVLESKMRARYPKSREALNCSSGSEKENIYLRLRPSIPHPSLIVLAIQVTMLVHLDHLMENTVLTFGVEQ